MARTLQTLHHNGFERWQLSSSIGGIEINYEAMSAMCTKKTDQFPAVTPTTPLPMSNATRH